jgi:hypothetical protein
MRSKIKCGSAVVAHARDHKDMLQFGVGLVKSVKPLTIDWLIPPEGFEGIEPVHVTYHAISRKTFEALVELGLAFEECNDRETSDAARKAARDWLFGKDSVARDRAERLMKRFLAKFPDEVA